ncbi:MAG: MbnP family copper-binding protein [Pseudomonadota bacterium]
MTMMFRAIAAAAVIAGTTSAASLAAEPFALRFMAMHGDSPTGCTEAISGLGAAGDVTVGISDLRFYVSGIVFLDAAGAPLATELSPSDFQLITPEGSVALVDLTDASTGACAPGSISFGEGTERVNDSVTGTRAPGDAAGVTFRIGVPQGLMRTVIAATAAEDAPSPMREMYWNWAGGYRHFVLNHTVDVADGRFGEGYLHIGSMDCGPAEGKALSDRDRCGFVYTPAVTLPITGEGTETVVAIDLEPLFAAVDFVAPVYDAETFAVIGERPGTDCHSSSRQPDCTTIFPTFGLDMETGEADAAANRIFRIAE